MKGGCREAIGGILDAGKNYIVNRERWVRVSEELIKDLNDLVGEGCVKTG